MRLSATTSPSARPPTIARAQQVTVTARPRAKTCQLSITTDRSNLILVPPASGSGEKSRRRGMAAEVLARWLPHLPLPARLAAWVFRSERRLCRRNPLLGLGSGGGRRGPLRLLSGAVQG